jgi:hypothetical protein
MIDWDYSKTWYHGSPIDLTTIRPGSTITQNRRLAEVFSHKPPLVSIDDDGSLTHNGVQPGYLYSISEDISPDDITPHPRSAMKFGEEWLTNRELQVSLIGPVPITTEEMLTEEEVQELLDYIVKQQVDG